MSTRLRRRVGCLLIGATLGTSISVQADPIQTNQLDYKGHWAEVQLIDWVDRGILLGYEDGTLRPNATVTRAEFAKMLVEVFGLEYINPKDVTYTDVKEDAWYEVYAACTVSAGLMKVDGEMFRPNAFITREEAAYAVATAYHINKDGNLQFVDGDKVSEWAQAQVKSLALAGYINGYEDGTFRPQGELTRAEAVMMLDNITAEIINTSGTYTKDIIGNVVVNTTDVILKDMTITGNIYLAEGIGEGDVILDNVKVTGQTIVEGGGENSIELIGTHLDNIVVQKASGIVRLAADTASSMGSVYIQSAVQVEGTIQKVEISTAQEVKLVKATVEEVKVVEAGAKLVLDKDSMVQKVLADAKVDISGQGSIQNALINADDVKIEGVKIDKDKIVVSDSVETKPEISLPNTSGGSSGGSGSIGPINPVNKPDITGVVKLEQEIAADAKVVLFKMVNATNSFMVAETVTDVNGNYTFKEVEAGDYRLEIAYEKDGKLYETYVTGIQVGQQSITQNVILEKLESTTFTFTVTDEVGPVEGVEVLASAYVEGVTDWGRRGITDGQGQVILSSPYSFLQGTEVTYTLKKEGYKSQTVVYKTLGTTNTIDVTLVKEEPLAEVTEVTVTPTEVVLEDLNESIEFIIQFPKTMTLVDELPKREYLATGGTGVKTYTSLPIRVNNQTLKVKASFEDLQQGAWVQFHVPSEFFVDGQKNVVTPKIKIDAKNLPSIETGKATVTPNIVTTREGEEHEFTITLPKGVTFKRDAVDEYLLTTSSSINILTFKPVIIDDTTMKVKTNLCDVQEGASFQFVIRNVFLNELGKNIITEVIQVELIKELLEEETVIPTEVYTEVYTKELD